MDSAEQNQLCLEMKGEYAVSPTERLEGQQNDSLLWYEAITKYGKIFIGLFKGQIEAANHIIYKSRILENIKTLSREERMIQLLEDWLQVGLDLRPTSDVNGEFYTFKLSDCNRVANNISNKIVVKFEHHSIDKLPIPNWHKDMNLYLTSSDALTNLILSSNTIDIAYQELLKENAILMIPESFSDTWLGYVKSPEISSSTIPINIENNLQTIGIDNEIQPPDSVGDQSDVLSTEQLNISLNKAIKLPFHFLLGWTNKGSCIISKPLTYYPISINVGNTCIAVGRLVSISNGYGIHINEVL
ncbi:MAG: hypothetical protein P8163_19360 [Candidatus Thiodiazotropha sp.]